MKKVIILIALILGIKVNAQIVGGFVPLNSTKTPTMGGLKVTGAITSPTIYGSSAASGTLYLRGSSSATPGLVSIGSSTGSNFNIAGTTTLTGAAKLTSTTNIVGNNTLLTPNTVTLTTGATSGTVAVLSDALFSINFMSTATNLGDGVTYYFGNIPYLLTASQTSLGAVKVPYNCTLVGYSYGTLYTPGTAENATLSINGTTNYTLSSTITFSTAGNSDTRYVTGLSQDFNSGDIMNGKLACPNYVTNPSFVHTGLTLLFVRRQ
jgi:hypothetical protein